MKNMLFELISNIGKYIIVVIDNFRDGLLIAIAWLLNTTIWIIANIFRVVLSIIDSERINHAEQASEQYGLTREIELLGAISAVKEDALDQKTWLSEHTNALNILGSQLINECEWEERRVHRYIKKIVESIPGLQYAGSVEEDDEDIELG